MTAATEAPSAPATARAFHGISLNADPAKRVAPVQVDGLVALASSDDAGEHARLLPFNFPPLRRLARAIFGHRQANNRPRSSLSQQLGALGDAGGVNSINNFARSWQRAAGFFEITPVRPSFRVESDGDDDGEGDDGDEESVGFTRSGLPTSVPDQRSALRQALQHGGRRPSDNAVTDDEHGGPTEETNLLPNTLEGRLRTRGSSIFQVEPSLSSPFGGSYGTGYGSLTSRVNESSMRHAGRLFTEQQMKGVGEPESEREPLLVKQIEEDGQIINVVVGQSTLPQTIFNSVNVLIGVGLLTLPLALKYSGWLIGMLFLTWSAIVTSYTAKLLAKCLDVDTSLITFADLAFVSFGNKARIAVSMLFSLELLAACVALVVLFADSMEALLPSLGFSVTQWKVVCGLILIPLSFLPLRFLSFTSILGVMSCFGSMFPEAAIIFLVLLLLLLLFC